MRSLRGKSKYFLRSLGSLVRLWALDPSYKGWDQTLLMCVMGIKSGWLEYVSTVRVKRELETEMEEDILDS